MEQANRAIEAEKPFEQSAETRGKQSGSIDAKHIDVLDGVRALAVFGAAIGATLLVLLLHRVILPRFGIHIGSEEALPLASKKNPPRVDSRGTPISKTKPRGR